MFIVVTLTYTCNIKHLYKYLLGYLYKNHDNNPLESWVHAIVHYDPDSYSTQY